MGDDRIDTVISHIDMGYLVTLFALIHGGSNGGRQFTSNGRSTRQFVPLYSDTDRLVTRVFRFEAR